eukprot:748662-Hanusia_phi.AAC.1
MPKSEAHPWVEGILDERERMEVEQERKRQLDATSAPNRKRFNAPDPATSHALENILQQLLAEGDEEEEEDGITEQEGKRKRWDDEVKEEEARLLVGYKPREPVRAKKREQVKEEMMKMMEMMMMEMVINMASESRRVGRREEGGRSMTCDRWVGSRTGPAS